MFAEILIISSFLSWDPSPTPPEVLGYRVYFGESSREYSQFVDVRLDTFFSLSGFGDGTYFFSVTAYNTKESEFSNEVSTTITSVKENEIEAVPVFSIYPSVFSDFTTIRGQGEVKIFNVLGQLVKTVPEHQRRVNTMEFPVGVYFFRFKEQTFRGAKIK